MNRIYLILFSKTNRADILYSLGAEIMRYKYKTPSAVAQAAIKTRELIGLVVSTFQYFLNVAPRCADSIPSSPRHGTRL